MPGDSKQTSALYIQAKEKEKEMTTQKKRLQHCSVKSRLKALKFRDAVPVSKKETRFSFLFCPEDGIISPASGRVSCIPPLSGSLAGLLFKGVAFSFLVSVLRGGLDGSRITPGDVAEVYQSSGMGCQTLFPSVSPHFLPIPRQSSSDLLQLTGRCVTLSRPARPRDVSPGLS